MTEYEKLKTMLHDNPFVSVNMPLGTAYLASEGKVFQSLLRDNPMDCSTATINAGSALAGFAALKGVGMEDRTFTTDELATIGGMNRILVHNYVQKGILRPSISGRTGGATALRFSWRDAYVCGLVGAFRRLGLVPYLLQQVADLFYDDNQQERTDRKLTASGRS